MKWLKKLQNTYLNEYLLSRYSTDYQVDNISNIVWQYGKIYRILREKKDTKQNEHYTALK